MLTNQVQMVNDKIQQLQTDLQKHKELWPESLTVNTELGATLHNSSSPSVLKPTNCTLQQQIQRISNLTLNQGYYRMTSP